jgi:cell wall-associated NlpC family hydrolase
MLKRFAPLVPFTFVLAVTGCATSTSSPVQPLAQVPTSSEALGQIQYRSHQLSFADALEDGDTDSDAANESLAALINGKPYRLPSLADTTMKSNALAQSILERGFQLVGTPYRFGGESVRTGFDCSGFVSYLFREKAGIELPRSTRELINMDAPLVARNELKPGDILFFNNRGRGRVSHTAIYIGDDQFIHSASRRSGGVRVDSLDDGYWRASFMEAKRVLAQASTVPATAHR